MSLSLSSLLNPSPIENDVSQADGTSTEDAQAQSRSPVQQRESLPSISTIQSPESYFVQIPQYTPPERPRPQAFASPSDASYGATQQRAQDGTRRASGGSGNAVSIELPPPPASGHRKMSSPTLEQYHVASRSPEQIRRTSASINSGMVLPPLQTTDAAVVSEREDVDTSQQGSQQLARETAISDSHSHAISAASTNTLLHTSFHNTPAQQIDKQPVAIKEEAVASPQDTSLNVRHPPSFAGDHDQVTKALSHLKSEHASRTQSPLRESSFAIPSTEDMSPKATSVKKRPAPTRNKKGTATSTKKRGPTKKRKTDGAKPTLKNGSSLGTPAMSSPTPSDAHSLQAEEYDEDDSMADSDEDVEGSGDVYCICRKPDNGTFMIGCDGQCDDWFHGKCVGIEERDKNLIDRYICPRCTAADVGQTSWKRMCRRQGCRQPARVGRNAGKNGSTSKYCSDECGVMFFRQMTANSRGIEQTRKERATRRKSGIANVSERNDDAGARGSVLSIGEIRAMLDQTNSAEDFRELGNGVLSPPATPAGSTAEDDGMTEMERDAVKLISAQKEQARERHQLLKDRLKFITFVKDEANRAAAEKDLKPKEYCGYDKRLEWTEEEFSAWRRSKSGERAFENDSLEDADHSDDVMEILMADEPNHDPENDVCARKKCARHMDWSKLAVDDIRFEMSDNSDRMRNLEHEEQETKDRASMRARARKYDVDEGQVEVHGKGDTQIESKGISQSHNSIVEADAKLELPASMEVEAAS